MYAKVHEMSNLKKAFQAVKKNRGAAGVDKVMISDYKQELDSNLEALQDKLLKQTYIPKPVRRVYIDKQDGSKRPLGIPTVEDRIVQQALRQVIEPIFEKKFLDCSYGFRPDRNCHQAVEDVNESLKRKYRYVIDADLKSYFDMIDHDLLLDEIGLEIEDNDILSLITKTLKSGILDYGCYQETIRGATQGSNTSPLYGNIYLHPMDKLLTERGHKVVRYADDFVILHTSRKGAERVLKSLTKFLKNKYKLTLHPEKTKIIDTFEEQFTFLGFVFNKGYLGIDKTRVKAFKGKVKALTRRNQTVNMMCFLKESLNSIIRGWGNYYGKGNVKNLFNELMSWIKRRLRGMQMRSWKTVKKFNKALRKAGWRGEIIPIAIRGWRNTKTIQSHMAMSNRWFKEQGLVDLVDIYDEFHPQRG